VIVVDLEADPREFAGLDSEQLRERVFTSQQDLGEEQARLPLKLVHLNKCPILATTRLLDDQAAKRLHIDRGACEQHWHHWRRLLAESDLRSRIEAIYRTQHFTAPADPEARLYDGFISDADKQLMERLRALDGEALANSHLSFDDERLNQMLPRYRARNFPQSLSVGEQKQWRAFVGRRLTEGEEHLLSFGQLLGSIESLLREHRNEASKLAVLTQLQHYAREHMARWQ
jgi:exodeoxyribonuclease-1